MKTIKKMLLGIAVMIFGAGLIACPALFKGMIETGLALLSAGFLFVLIVFIFFRD